MSSITKAIDLSKSINEAMSLTELRTMLDHPENQEIQSDILSEYIWFLSDKSDWSLRCVVEHYERCEELAGVFLEEATIGDVVKMLVCGKRKLQSRK